MGRGMPASVILGRLQIRSSRTRSFHEVAVRNRLKQDTSDVSMNSQVYIPDSQERYKRKQPSQTRLTRELCDAARNGIPHDCG